MKVELIITRKVLFEKFDIKHEMEIFFLSFLDGCEIKLSEKYPGSIFFIKNDVVLFEQETKNKYFYIRYDSIWWVFGSKYGLDYFEIRSFTKEMLGTHIKKFEGYTFVQENNLRFFNLEMNLKNDGCDYIMIGNNSRFNDL